MGSGMTLEKKTTLQDEEISFQENHQSEKLVTPSDVVADKPTKRYQYDYTIGEDPNPTFKNFHPTEPISKQKVTFIYKAKLFLNYKTHQSHFVTNKHGVKKIMSPL